MSDDYYFRCSGDHGRCERTIPRGQVIGAITSDPAQTRSFSVLTSGNGTWHAYRGARGKVERVFCDAHHHDADG